MISGQVVHCRVSLLNDSELSLLISLLRQRDISAHGCKLVWLHGARIEGRIGRCQNCFDDESPGYEQAEDQHAYVQGRPQCNICALGHFFSWEPFAEKLERLEWVSWYYTPFLGGFVLPSSPESISL